MAVVLRFPLMNFLHNVLESYKTKSDELTRKKIKFLKNEAYKVFLEEYLSNIEKEGTVDFHPSLYRAKLISCPEAEMKAERAVLGAIRSGMVNELFSRRIKAIRGRK